MTLDSLRVLLTSLVVYAFSGSNIMLVRFGNVLFRIYNECNGLIPEVNRVVGNYATVVLEYTQ